MSRQNLWSIPTDDLCEGDDLIGIGNIIKINDPDLDGTRIAIVEHHGELYPRSFMDRDGISSGWAVSREVGHETIILASTGGERKLTISSAWGPWVSVTVYDKDDCLLGSTLFKISDFQRVVDTFGE